MNAEMATLRASWFGQRVVAMNVLRHTMETAFQQSATLQIRTMKLELVAHAAPATPAPFLGTQTWRWSPRARTWRAGPTQMAMIAPLMGSIWPPVRTIIAEMPETPDEHLAAT